MYLYIFITRFMHESLYIHTWISIHTRCAVFIYESSIFIRTLHAIVAYVSQYIYMNYNIHLGITIFILVYNTVSINKSLYSLMNGIKRIVPVFAQLVHVWGLAFIVKNISPWTYVQYSSTHRAIQLIDIITLLHGLMLIFVRTCVCFIVCVHIIYVCVRFLCVYMCMLVHARTKYVHVCVYTCTNVLCMAACLCTGGLLS